MAEIMTTNVHDYLDDALSRRWRWGGGAQGGFEGDDCTLFAANWALAWCGRDPAAGIRGTYSTKREALSIVARAGGMEHFVDRQLRSIGWARISEEYPVEGDIAVAVAPLADGKIDLVPVIRAGGLWVGRTERGQIAQRFTIISLWRFGCLLVDMGPPPQRRYRGRISSHALQCSGGTYLQPAQQQQTGILEGLILTALTSIGVTGTALQVLTPLLTGLVVTGLSVGLQYLLTPKPPKPEDGHVPLTQAIPPRVFLYGETRVSGAYMLFEEKNGTLYTVQALLGHPSNDITKIYLSDSYVTAFTGDYEGDAGAVPTSMSINDGRYIDSTVRIGYRLGAVPESPYLFTTDKLAGDGVWTETCRGDGQTSLAINCRSAGQRDQLKRFPTGIPAGSAVVQGYLVWDPRDDDQDPDDPSTWVYSKNSILCLLHWECFSDFGPQRDYTKAVLPVVDIWMEEADICDESVARASGGSENRYECSGFGTSENDPKAIENAILNSCDGWLCERGDGAMIPRVGKFREELVVDVYDEDIAGYAFQNDIPEEDSFNRLVPKFTYPATDYTTSDTDYFEDVSQQLKDGRILSTDADLSWVQQWRQARRLAKRTWLRNLERRRGTMDFLLSGINAVYSPWIRINSTYRVPRLNGTIIDNRRASVALTAGGFQVEFTKLPDAIDDWTPSTDEGSAPPVPAPPSSSGIEVPEIDEIQIIVNSSNTYLRIFIVEPADDTLEIFIRYRLTDAGSGSPGDWSGQQQFDEWTADAGIITINTSLVPPNQELDVQAFFVASGGTRSTGSDIETITTTVDTVAPQALSSFAVTGGNGAAQLDFTTAAGDLHLSRIAIYRAPHGVALDKNAHFAFRLGAAVGSTFSYIDGDATISNIWPQPDFSASTGLALGTNWSISGGELVHATGSDTGANYLFTPGVGSVYRFGIDIVSESVAGTGVYSRLGGSTVTDGSPFTGAGKHFGNVTGISGGIAFGWRASTWVGHLDNAVLFVETAACAPQGDWDYYAIPENVSGVEGSQAGPHNVIII